MPQHLQEVPTRTLGLSSPFTRSRKNYTPQARKLAKAAPLHRALTRTRNNANPQVRLLKYKVEHFGDHLKHSHNKDPYRIDIVMDSSSVCEKTRIKVVVENTRNHF